MVVLMNPAIVFLLKNERRKSVTWEINKGKDKIKEDSQVSNKVPTINKDNRDHTLVINSIRTRVDLPTGHLNKGLIFSRGLPNWKKLWLNSCK